MYPTARRPVLLKPAEKVTPGILSDWPWTTSRDLCDLLGVTRARLSPPLGRLVNDDLHRAVRPWEPGSALPSQPSDESPTDSPLSSGLAL